MNNRRIQQDKRRHRMQGSVYIMVLASSMLLFLIGVSAIIGVRLQRKQFDGYQNEMQATQIAKSGMSLVVHEINKSYTWRGSRPSGTWYNRVQYGNGLMSVSVKDPYDDKLSINPNDPIKIIAMGDVGAAKSILSVELQPTAVDANAYTNAVMKSRPMAYWPLLEKTGTRAADLSYRYSGEYINGPVLAGTPGPNNDLAPKMDGDNDFVLIGHHDDMLLEEGSVALWFQWQSVNTRRYGIFSKDADSNGTGGHLNIYLEGKELYARLQSITLAYYVKFPDEIITGVWYHMVFTWGSGGMKLYVNGELVDTNSYTGGLGISSGGLGNHEPLVIGANSADTPDQSYSNLNKFFTGTIYQVSMYDRTLSSDNATALFNAGGLNRPFQIVNKTFLVGQQ